METANSILSDFSHKNLIYLCRFKKSKTHGLSQKTISSILDKYEQLCAFDANKNKFFAMHGSLEDRLLHFNVDDVTEEHDLVSVTDILSYCTKISNYSQDVISKLDSGCKFSELLGADCCPDFKQKILLALSYKLNTSFALRKKIRQLFAEKGYIYSKFKRKSAKKNIIINGLNNHSAPIKEIKNNELMNLYTGSASGYLSLSLLFTDDSYKELEDYALSLFGCDPCDADFFKEALKLLVEDQGGLCEKKQVFLQAKNKAEQFYIDEYVYNIKHLFFNLSAKKEPSIGIHVSFNSTVRLVVLGADGKVLLKNMLSNCLDKNSVITKNTIVSTIQKYKIKSVGLSIHSVFKNHIVFFDTIFSKLDVNVQCLSGLNFSGFKNNLVADSFADSSYITPYAIAKLLINPLGFLSDFSLKQLVVSEYQFYFNGVSFAAAVDKLVLEIISLYKLNINKFDAALFSLYFDFFPEKANHLASLVADNPIENIKELLCEPFSVDPDLYNLLAPNLMVTGEDVSFSANALVHPDDLDFYSHVASILKTDVATCLKEGGFIEHDASIFVSDQFPVDYVADCFSAWKSDCINIVNDGFFDFFRFNKDAIESNVVAWCRVKNISEFGVFFCIGNHYSGLLHLSYFTDSYSIDSFLYNDLVELRVDSVSSCASKISFSLASKNKDVTQKTSNTKSKMKKSDHGKNKGQKKSNSYKNKRNNNKVFSGGAMSDAFLKAFGKNKQN